MGFFADLKRRRANAASQHARAKYEDELQVWKQQGQELAEMAHLLDTFEGYSPMELAQKQISSHFVLHKDERMYLTLSPVGLCEPRTQAGHYQGGYSGFSFRLAKGVRYHVGGTRGTYVRGPEVQTTIDTGDAAITSERVVFQGSKQTREWSFSKLIGVEHEPQLPVTTIHVSNRQKTSGLVYGVDNVEMVHFRLALAVARFNETVPALVASLQDEMSEHEQDRPVEPARQLPSA